ncbi:MAG: gluconate 5-dehydrogenase [Candidatus Marinimicrobia bacterium]|nr:gluconate 5-dehydrogenase [Candidatus Neomarinimicrobiota bacterium]|tara:strand:+ start:17709 stop:18488 length:780 start_codon:yes stop_codon:yes gene_type:complete
MSNYLNQLFGLSNKIVVVVGAGGHLCSEMAQGFAKAGSAVVLLDADIVAAKAVANDICQNGGKAMAFEIDVTHKENFKDSLETVLVEFGQVDILVNGAGINAPTPFLEITEDEWDNIMAVQLKGTVFACQVFGQQMLNQGSGSIINISSASSGPPLSKAFTYSVAKAGIKNLTQNLAREWATKGVRVNALRPGFFPNEWNKKHFIDHKRKKAILGHTPMNRYGRPNELIGAVIWLASDAASFVTGAEISIDGGYSAMTI